MGIVPWYMTKKREQMLEALANCKGMPKERAAQIEIAVETFLTNFKKWHDQSNVEDFVESDAEERMWGVAVMTAGLPTRDRVWGMSEVQLAELEGNAQALAGWLGRMRREKHEERIRLLQSARVVKK